MKKQYIHVIASTLVPIPRASQVTAYESLLEVEAKNYNKTNGVKTDRKYLEIQNLEDPTVSDPIEQTLSFPTTLGFSSEADDTSSGPSQTYRGAPLVTKSDTVWSNQAKVVPQTLEVAKESALSVLTELEASVRSKGWPWPDTEYRVPIDTDTVGQLAGLASTLNALVGSGGLDPSNTVPVPFTTPTEFEPSIADVAKYSQDYFKTNFLIAAETGRLRSRIQRAETTKDCRNIVDTANYPGL